MATSVLVDDLQFGSTRLTGGTVLAADEVQAALDAGGLVVTDSDNGPGFGAVFDALPEVSRLKARGDAPGARIRMLRAYAEALAAQVGEASAAVQATYAQLQTLLASGKLPTRATLSIQASGLGTLPAGQKTAAASAVLPANAVLLGWGLDAPGGSINDNASVGGPTTYTLAATSFFTGENVKRGVGVYPRRPTSPDALAFSGNPRTYAGATITLTLTSSADLNTVDSVGGIELAIVYAVMS